MGANPHHQYMEINSHGYGILEINADSILGRTFYSEIPNITNVETEGQPMVMIDGDNHWKRSPNTAVSNLSSANLHVFPNPANDFLNIVSLDIIGDTLV